MMSPLEVDLKAFSFVICVGVALTVMIFMVLAYQICWPNIITYPWKEEEEQVNQTVIFAASYNPPHYGHIRILEYLSRRFTNVIAVVGFNPDKEYLVKPEQRAELLRDMLKSTTCTATNVKVEVVEGYIWRYAKRVGATRFIRGIRSWEKDGHDERALQILNTWGPIFLGPVFPIKTIYLEGDPNYNHISSTLIRDICSTSTCDDNSFDKNKENALSKLVPTEVAQKVAKLYQIIKK